ncbi:hypothetical protein V7x_24620 [Crateriforma conspicua]|uniref:Uncharacterized protein n=1 Tax=Crateriforma conspicua TaxID=2527996 RepID=A0A5C6FWR1_9PLAN|nr:hypothetical protein [Crateriforma conspicua]TWU66891.1 hypothetical protein V7x_24620 [Crateriforma conspicua]
MSQSQDLRTLRRMFPRMTSDRLVQAIERGKSVKAIAAAEQKRLIAENDRLSETIAELEQRIETLIAEREQQDADEAERTAPAAKAKARGNKPVAFANGHRPNLVDTHSLRGQWKALVADLVSQGMPRAKAVSHANRAYPDLRQLAVDEANSRRGGRRG